MIIRWLCERERVRGDSAGGVYPRPCVLLNGGGVCCCPAWSSGVVWCVPRLVRCVVVTIAVMLCTVLLPCPAVWCGCVCMFGVFVWWGILRLFPPLVVVEEGVVVGWWVVLWWWVV